VLQQVLVFANTNGQMGMKLPLDYSFMSIQTVQNVKYNTKKAKASSRELLTNLINQFKLAFLLFPMVA